MANNLTSKTLYGLKWTYISTIANAIVQIIFTAVMARLLESTTFGLVAMAMVVVNFGQFFAQMGVGRALIQKLDITEEHIRAGFTSSVSLGALFCALVLVAAPPIAEFFQASSLIPVLRVLAFMFVLIGLSTTSLSLLRRQLDFREIAIVEVWSSLVAYGGIGIVMAFLGFGIWSLVWSTLGRAGFAAVGYYMYCRHSVLPVFRWRYYRPLYAFGGLVSVISFFEYIGDTLDRLTIGRFMSASVLGIYERSQTLVNLPISRIATGVSKVLFPSFSKLQKEKARIGAAFLLAMRMASGILLPLCFGMAVAGHDIVLTVLGEQWIEAVPVFRVFSIAAGIAFLTHFPAVLCEAMAKLKAKLIIQVGYVSILFVILIWAQSYGLIGVAWGVLTAQIVRHIAYLEVVRRLLGWEYQVLHIIYSPSLIAGSIVAIAVYLGVVLTSFLALHSAVALIVQILVAAVVLVALCLFGPLRDTTRRGVDKTIGWSKLSAKIPFIERVLLPETVK